MGTHKVTVFRPHPFEPGQKIRIAGGPRAGDWEVVAVSERKVRLRCPLSGQEVEWNRFCYRTEELENAVWPAPE